MASIAVHMWDTPPAAFEQQYQNVTDRGREVMSRSSVVFVGLARNCYVALAGNLQRACDVGQECGQWQLHIESNDCTDNTLGVLAGFCSTYKQATFHYQELNRPHCPAEFAGRRTIALAEYRTACQRWVKACARNADYVVVIDFDLWAGWQPNSIANAIGWLDGMDKAAGMASVSLYQHDHGGGPMWGHYDLWALRGVGQPRTYFDTYQNGYGGWGFFYLPPIGSEPVAVASAFGGMAVYRTAAYLCGEYDGKDDCEHVPFHRSIARATGQGMYLNPSQRTLVHWLETTNDAGKNLDSVPDVSGVT